MKSYNQSQFLGYVGQDPEIKTLEGGGKLATFSLATKESYKDKSGEVKSNTYWHNIIAFGKRADIVERFLKKVRQFL